MKFIHTADWHLGNKMHGVDRNAETQAFLLWLRDKIIEENAETLVVSGDIFDTINPPIEARKQYNDFLASIINTCCKNVIITGGNHDSAALLDSQKELLEPLNIHIVGSLANKAAKDMIYELKDKEGNVNAICAAVPFARENELFTSIEDGSIKQEESSSSFSDRAYSALYRQVADECIKLRAERNIPIIATGHLYAADLEGRFEGEEGAKENADDGVRVLDVTGNLGAVHVGIFPKEFSYVALGHIHYCTRVALNDRIRYSGSPFVMGFDEAHIPHYVLSVEITPSETVSNADSVNVKKIESPRFNMFRRISGDSKTIKDELLKYKNRSDRTNLYTDLYTDVYIEIYYKKEDGININDELDELVEELQKQKVYIVSRRIQDIDIRSYKDFDGEEVKNLEPEEIFKSLILSKCNVSFEGTTEEIKEKESAYVNKYLDLFIETFNEFSNGSLNADN